MITLQLKEEHSETNRVTFQWQGMTISLQTISSHGGGKFLYVMVENASFAQEGLAGNWAKWIIWREDTEQGGAPASTTSNGSANPVTSRSTGER